MTKKLLFGVVLFGVGIASATTTAQNCTGGATATGAVTATPTASGTATCGAFTIPVGMTLTSVELVLQGDFQLANAGSNTLNWNFSVNNPVNGITLNGTAMETVTGTNGNSSSFTWSGVGCTAPDTALGLGNGADCVTSVNFTNPPTGLFGPFNVGISGAWAAGSVGLAADGSEGARVVEVVYTFGQTSTVPEPAALLLIGSGLVCIGVVSRKRRKA